MRVHLLSLLACAALSAGDRDDLPYLVAALDSPVPLVAGDAHARLLIAGPEAIPLLLSAAEDELARRADLLPRIERLIRDLDSDDYDSRERAELDLVEIGPEALPALREAAAHGSPEQQARAQGAVDRIGAGAAVPPRFLVRLSHAISAQPDDRCVPTLVAFARQPEVPVMSDAIEGLWRLGTEAAVAALRSLAEEANVDRRWLARAALLASGVDLDLSPEAFVADWPSRETREVLYSSLRRWESPRVVRFALSALKREGVTAPAALLTVLEEVADSPFLTREVLESLRQELPWNRGVLLGLLRDPTPEAVAVLTDALANPEWRARQAAARMLARLKGEEAAGLIEPLLGDPDPVRLTALRALHAVGGRDAAPFREALDNPLLANEAIEYALVRMPGAERSGSIENRIDGPPDEDCGAIERWLEAVLDPVLRRPFQEQDYLPRPVTRDPVRRYVLAAAQALQGPLPPRPIEVQGAASRFRDFLALDAGPRAAAIRAGLRAEEGDRWAEAARWAVWEGCDGLEEDLFPLLSCGNAATEEIARLYLARRKTDDLSGRVRRMALGSDPGSAPLLWVQWEGRAAAKALLERLKEPGTPPSGLLRALAQAPLEAPDALLLLAFPVSEGADGRALCAALHRTGSADAQVRLRELATLLFSPSEEAWIELAADPADIELVLRFMRASRGIVVDSSMRSPRLVEAIGSPAAMGELAARVAVPAWSDVESIARAMVRLDRESARARAAEWHRSLHAPRRLAALWIDLLSGETPSKETTESLASAGTVYRVALLAAARESGSAPLAQACVPLLVDPEPDVRVSAWHALAACVGGTPEGHGNTFSVPVEVRRAWAAWFEANPGVDRRQALAARMAGAVDDEEDLLQCFVRGPQHVAMAAWIEHGARPDDMPTTPQSFVDEAVRWRDSLR